MHNQFSLSRPIRIIECRIQFLNLGVVDTIHETFRASVLIKSRWREPIFIDEYKPERHWNPLLVVENGQTIPTVNWSEKVSYSVVNLGDVTEITEARLIDGDFWERFELKDFPLGESRNYASNLSLCL